MGPLLIMDFEQIESSQRQHHNEMLFQERMIAATESSQYNLVSLLKPKIYIDGNQWCVIYGDNIQDGVCGFGDTPLKAICEFNSSWYKGLSTDIKL